MPTPITDYALEWNESSHTGQIAIKLSDLTTKNIVLPADELLVVATILSKSSASFDSTTGIVSTGSLKVGT